MIRGAGRWGLGRVLAWTLTGATVPGGVLPLGAQDITDLNSDKMPSDPVEALLVLRQEWGLVPAPAGADRSSHPTEALPYRIGDELLEEGLDREAVTAGLTAQLERLAKLVDSTALEESRRAAFKKAYGAAEARVRGAILAGTATRAGEREAAREVVRQAFAELLGTADSLLELDMRRSPTGYGPPRGP